MIIDKKRRIFNKKTFIKRFYIKIKLKNCEKGYIFTGLATLLIFSFLLIGILILNFSVLNNEINNDLVGSNNFNYIIDDYKKNIPIIGREIIGNLSNQTIKNHVACYGSRDIIKNELEKALIKNNPKYLENSGLKIEIEVLSVTNGDDPFHVIIKTLLVAKKGKMKYNNVVNSIISIEDFKDPLPFLMCKNYPTLKENGTKIDYKDALSHYLKENNLLNPEVYENATSPLKIKKCIYDPYEQHGKGFTMKNCVDNGYFHESADGSCYLCRLEGKGSCPHYGLEVFIIPSSIDKAISKSICGSDHVIFHDHYPGNSLIFYEKDSIYETVVIDDSHKSKYGLNE
jgi:hypothetical protein